MNDRDWLGLPAPDPRRDATGPASDECRVVRAGEGYAGARAVVARIDPDEQASVVLLPELDALAP